MKRSSKIVGITRGGVLNAARKDEIIPKGYALSIIMLRGGRAVED